jgi:ferritin-like metal-binding protein YciE
MKIENLQELFEVGLQYAYDCEQQLIKALPKMAKAATLNELRVAFEQHLQETQRHSDRLEQVFASIGKSPKTQSNDVVKALTKEGENMIDTIERSPLLDAALIVAGNQVEHYEMAAYGSLRTFAQLLGNNQAVTLLEQTLQEEKAADQKLTQIAETRANREAAQVGATTR